MKWKQRQRAQDLAWDEADEDASFLEQPHIQQQMRGDVLVDPSHYSFFWRSGSPFSQWHTSTYVYQGHPFSCTEQGMMYGKAILFGDSSTAMLILAETSPRKMKALGRKVRGFSDKLWKRNREQIVFHHNYAKFTQNDHLRKALLATGERTLVEASPSDAIWGIGLHESAALHTPLRQWPGLNLLGKVLMRVRETIQEEMDVFVTEQHSNGEEEEKEEDLELST